MDAWRGQVTPPGKSGPPKGPLPVATLPVTVLQVTTKKSGENPVFESCVFLELLKLSSDFSLSREGSSREGALWVALAGALGQ